jgi:spore germination protein
MQNNQIKPSLTSKQAAMITSKSMIGTGILILPQSVAKSVNTPDGWITVVLCGLLAMASGWVIASLSRRFPGRTIYAFGQDIVGKWVGIPLALLISMYYVLSSGYLLRVMGEVVRMYLLDKTPISVIMLAFMGVAVYLTTAGMSAIAQLIELFLPIIVLILVVFIIFSFGDFELDNLRPVLGEGMSPIWKGMKPSILSYSGFEVMLFVTAYMAESRKAIQATLAGIAVTTVLYTLVVIVAIGTLTVDELKTVTWPTMSVAMNIELPRGFFERFESLFTVLWVLTMFTAFVMYHFGASLGLGQLTDKRFQIFSYLTLPVIYIVAVLPENLNKVFKVGDYVGYISLFMFGVIPICLLLIAVVRRIGNATNRS